MSTILVVGSPGSGKKTLVQALLRLLRPRDAEQLDSAASGTPEAACGHPPPGATAVVEPDRQVLIDPAAAIFDVYPALITTKYYSAQVSLWRQAQSTAPVLALRSATQLENLEGIIVVFDLRQEHSFDEAAQWAAFVDDKEQCTFRVCVGSKLDLLPQEKGAGGGAGFGEGLAAPSETAAAAAAAAAGAATEDEGGNTEGNAESMAEGLQERRRCCLEWCLDNGFEYVEADCRDSHTGRELREKEGVPRIVEALQSNVWTGMEFCTSNRPSLMAAAAAASSRSGGGGVGGTGSVSESSGGGDGTAALSPSVGDGHQEVSEFLSGFIDEEDAGAEYAGYGALDSGGEEEEEEDEGVGGDSTGLGGGVSSSTEEGGVREGSAGPTPEGSDRREGRGDGNGVDPAHIELQARWEQRGVTCPSASPASPASPANAAPAGGQSTNNTGHVEEQEAEQSEPARSGIAPAHDGDDGTEKRAGAVGIPGGGAAAASSGAQCDVPVGPGGVVRAGGEGAAAPEKPEEYLLEAAGSMVGGLGVDLEGDEMEQIMGEMRKARELGSSVPDAERRSRAADVAMRLAALLGDLGDDSGDDDAGDGDEI